MIEQKLAFLLAGLIAACLAMSGCQVHAGIDWNGKSDVSKTIESPGYRQKGRY